MTAVGDARKRAQEAQAPTTAPIPADSGAIGRLNEAEKTSLAAAFRRAAWLESTAQGSYEWAAFEDDVIPFVAEAFERILREHTDRALAEVEQRIEHGPHRLGHNVSVVCSCVRCEATHACLAIVRAARQEQGR